jgi:GAF domain-containing protein
MAMEKGRRLDDVTGMKLSMEEAGLTAWVIRERRSLLVYNMLENNLPVEPKHVGDPALSWLGVPLLVRDRLIGAISVQSFEPNAFNEADRRFVESLAAQVAISLENARLYEQTSRRLKQLQALRSIDIAITASVDLGVTLDILLDQVTKQLNIDAAAVWLFNAAEQRLHLAATRGFRTNALERLTFRPGDGLVGRAVLERDPVYIPDLSVILQEFPAYSELLEEGFVAYYGLPLIAKGQVKGVLEVYHRIPIKSDDEWLDFLETVATEAAIAVDNADLFNDLQRSNLELNLMYDRTLESWAQALELRGWENPGHTQRVVDMTLDLARDLGIDGDALINVRRGAYLHDFGNIQVPDSILLKAGELNDEEWALIRKHPTFAYDQLSLIPNLRPAMDIPYCHHEKWDGSGYPRSIRGEQIPIAARIFAVVDVWDVLRSDRPYRDAWSDKNALEYIKDQSGSHFDPNVVEAFLKYIRVRGFS